MQIDQYKSVMSDPKVLGQIQKCKGQIKHPIERSYDKCYLDKMNFT